MSTLRIFLFGDMRLTYDDSPGEVNLAHSARALLAYLLLQPHHVHLREVLADAFWGDRSQDRARSCLNTALWRLRRVLEPAGMPTGRYLITSPNGDVGFNWHSDHWLDVATFEQEVNRGLARPLTAMTAGDAQRLEDAVQTYTGELLESFYDDWALRERERLRCLYLNTLAHLMQYYHQQGLYDRSITHGRQILDLDPLREEIHRALMQVYVEHGQRALAIRQYHACCDLLREELGIKPMAETQTLYAHIAHEADGLSSRPADSHEPLNLQHALRQLTTTLRQLDKARNQLQRTIRLIDRLGGSEGHPNHTT